MGQTELSGKSITESIVNHRVITGIVLILALVSGYFYFYNQFWTHLDPDTLTCLKEYTGSRFRGYRGRQVLVHRDFYGIADQIHRYAVNNNLHLLITQSYRPPGKKVDDAIVEPAVTSNHLAGHALDFNVVYGGHVFESGEMRRDQFHTLPHAVKNFIKDIQSDERIRWGGDFETQDPVHIDDAVNINDSKTWNAHYHQCAADYVNAVPKWRSWLQQTLTPGG